MHDFEKHKKQFFTFLDKIERNEMVGIIAHANCLDGMASVVFVVDVLKKKYPSVKADINFVSYSLGTLDKLSEKFVKIGIKRVFILDLNVDVSLFDEFERMRKKFEVLLVDHHPSNPKFKIDEKVIKTPSVDCTSLVIYKFGNGIIYEKEWAWLVCVASVSEFSWKKDETLKFIQKHYPDYVPGDENSDLLKLAHKINSLVVYYSKDSLKAYEIISNKKFDKIEEIHKEVDSEIERNLDDFEKNAESHSNKQLYFYFFKSKFSLGSNLGTALSIRYKFSTIVVFSEIEGTQLVKVSARNNGIPLPYSMNDMLKAGIEGLENSMAGGHAPASGGSFMKKDLDRFKENVKRFVKSKIK